MVPLNRCICNKLSEATCLKYIGQAYHSLDSWEDFGKEYLLTCPALHVDETGFRVNNKNWWLHVATDDPPSICIEMILALFRFTRR